MEPIRAHNWLEVLICCGLASACSSEQQQPTPDAMTPGQATFVRSALVRSESPQVDQNEISTVVAGNNEFAMELYARLRSDDGNLFFSPYSISEAMAMAWAGAAGTAESEIGEVFHFGSQQAQTHAALNAINRQLVTDGEQPVVNIANAMWIDDGGQPGEAFLDVLALNYGSGVGVVDFDEPDNAVAEINAWVAGQTNDLIPNLLAPADVADASAVLTNTVYFKASWLLPFAVAATVDMPFVGLNGGTSNVPMMSALTPCAYAETSEYQAAALPFVGVGDERYEMLFVMPTDFSTFEPTFDSAQLAQVVEALQAQDVYMGVPRLELDLSLRLKEQLAALGMPSAFELGADFSAVSTPAPGRIRDVVHQATLSLDESGIEAAAATAVIFGDASIVEHPVPPPRMELLRPFLIAVRHVTSGTLLFLGRVVTF